MSDPSAESKSYLILKNYDDFIMDNLVFIQNGKSIYVDKEFYIQTPLFTVISINHTDKLWYILLQFRDKQFLKLLDSLDIAVISQQSAPAEIAANFIATRKFDVCSTERNLVQFVVPV